MMAFVKFPTPFRLSLKYVVCHRVLLSYAGSRKQLNHAPHYIINTSDLGSCLCTNDGI